MSEEVKSFIDKLAQNDMGGAGDAFKDSLRGDFPYSLSRILITVLPNSSSLLSKASKQT